MIQRIQSFYLLLTALLPALFIKGSFLRFINNSGIEIYMNLKGIWKYSEGGNDEMIRSLVPLSVIMIMISVLSVTAIFLFNKRKIQMKLAGAVFLLAILFTGLVLYYFLWVTGKFQADLIQGFKMVIPLLVLIFSFLAFRGIKHDENLVRSYDRLR